MVLDQNSAGESRLAKRLREIAESAKAEKQTAAAIERVREMLAAGVLRSAASMIHCARNGRGE